jgi:hypothetical protein
MENRRKNDCHAFDVYRVQYKEMCFIDITCATSGEGTAYPSGATEFSV